VIVDSAEALGATYKGRHAGAGARAAVYSFNGNKIITTSGGGMLASEDRDLIEHARFLSQQARDPAPYLAALRRMRRLGFGMTVLALGPRAPIAVASARAVGFEARTVRLEGTWSDATGLIVA
jgi:dTDP-4-amino-4,6-dideoxygalactose transaminase